jgi:hypothetical protein
LELTVKAKAAIAADPLLKEVNPIISIVDRVAVVGGPVPSDAAAERIGEVLRRVPGLTDVRVSCWVETADDPLKRLVADRLGTTPPPHPVPRSYAQEPATLPDPRPAAQVVAQRTTMGIGSLLMDPVSPRSPNSPVRPQYPTIPAPAVPVRPKTNLATAIEDILQADPRFSGLTAAVRGDAVVITGRAAEGAAWDLADAIRRIPGVGRVVFSRIESR